MMREPSYQKRAERALTDQMKLLPKGQLITVLLILSIAMLATFMDQNGVSVTIPIIGTSLKAENTISWAGTSSLIANTVFSVLYGRLSDIFGRKKVFISALGVLSVADLACALSQNGPMLYFFRAVAGAAGGGVTNLTMMILSDVVSLEERGKYQGILGSNVGLGNVAGPFIAAAFLGMGEREDDKLGAGWRSFFYFLAPLVAVCAVVSGLTLPNLQKQNKQEVIESGGEKPLDFKGSLKLFDWGGLALASLSIVLLLIPISGGGSYFAWSSPLVISFLSIGGLLLVAFIVWEWKFAKLPMIPVHLFSDRAITAVLAQSFLIGMVYQSYLYYLPLYYQNVRRWSPVVSAALVCPIVIPQALVSVVSGQFISRKKRYGVVLWFGYGIWTLGSALAAGIFDVNTHPAAIVFILLCVGTGVGCVFQPTLVALQAHAPKPKRAVVISARNFFRCLGGAVGLAISAATLQATLKQKLPDQFSDLADSTYSLESFDRSSVSDEEWTTILGAFMRASQAVLIVQAPLMAFCFISMILVKDNGLERPDEKAERESKEATPVNSTADLEKAIESDGPTLGDKSSDEEKSDDNDDKSVEAGSVFGRRDS